MIVGCAKYERHRKINCGCKNDFAIDAKHEIVQDIVLCEVAICEGCKLDEIIDSQGNSGDISDDSVNRSVAYDKELLELHHRNWIKTRTHADQLTIER